MTASTKVIGPGVQDAGAPNYTQRPLQTDLLIFALVCSITLIVGLNIAQIAHVPHLVIWTSMHVAMRVIVRPGSRAPIGQITVHVHMEAVELARVQPRELTRNECACEGALLFKEHDALTRLVRLRVQNADSPARLNW